MNDFEDAYLKHTAQGLEIVQSLLPGTPLVARKKVKMYHLVVQVENEEAIVEADASIVIESRNLEALFKLRDLLAALPIDLFPPVATDFDPLWACLEIRDIMACLASTMPEDDDG